MEIKNLAQLKRVIQEKREFIIRAHRQEKFLGQKRIPNVVQSNGFYSVISGQPEHEVQMESLSSDGWDIGCTGVFAGVLGYDALVLGSSNTDDGTQYVFARNGAYT